MLNHKTKEWAIKANPQSAEIYNSGDWPYNCAAWSGEEVAELIRIVAMQAIKVVRESETQCAGTTYDLSVVDCTKRRLEQSLREHFEIRSRVEDSYNV